MAEASTNEIFWPKNWAYNLPRSLPCKAFNTKSLYLPHFNYFLGWNHFWTHCAVIRCRFRKTHFFQRHPVHFDKKTGRYLWIRIVFWIGPPLSKLKKTTKGRVTGKVPWIGIVYWIGLNPYISTNKQRPSLARYPWIGIWYWIGSTPYTS